MSTFNYSKKPIKRPSTKLTVAELFAGVGGFRLGLEGWKGYSALSGYMRRKRSHYEIIWSNQWEPKTKNQIASDIYVAQFGGVGHANKDIAKIPSAHIPDHDLMVGGFPCQDYSVANRTKTDGIKGKKGMLWWQIHRILRYKARSGHVVKYVLLENVDHLLKSPLNQKGRDFAMMLASLNDLGYIVEWRVINAADYGFPQRRKRIFILAYHNSTTIARNARADVAHWLGKSGVMAQAFPMSVAISNHKVFTIDKRLKDILKNGSVQNAIDYQFENCGLMAGRQVTTFRARANFTGPRRTLADVLTDERDIEDAFYLSDEVMPKWSYVKGAKDEIKTKKGTAFTYRFTEGAVAFPDPTDRPSRTIITGEGSTSHARTTHIIRAGNGRLRRLTPIELERLNMFPDNHTASATNVTRGFLMGNALVVGIVERIGEVLANFLLIGI